MTHSDFNNLVFRISRQLYCQAYRILKNQEGAEDVVQDVFVKLWKMNTSLDEYNSVEALASTMLKNLCIDQIRKRKLRDTADELAVYGTADNEPTPYEELEKAETFAVLDSIIENLPGNYSELVHYRDIEALEYDEIAKKTGLNINTLRVNLSRARKIIRDEFKKYFNEYGKNKTTA